MRTRRAAFTLVELLVVIGIIALLISVLLPALNKAREQSKSAYCLSNLRQLGIGFQLYRQYNRDYYPPEYAFYGAGNAIMARSVYFWAGQSPDPATLSGGTSSIYYKIGSDKRYLNSYIKPKIGTNDPFPIAHCPSDDLAWAAYGSSYTANYFPGSGLPGSATRLATLTDPNGPTPPKDLDATKPETWPRPIKGSQAKLTSEFILVGENTGVSQAYADESTQMWKRYHNPKVDRWNMLFADGHATPVDVTKVPGSTARDRTTWVQTNGPMRGPGWRFEWRVKPLPTT